jgi:hypothetical protein
MSKTIKTLILLISFKSFAAPPKYREFLELVVLNNQQLEILRIQTPGFKQMQQMQERIQRSGPNQKDLLK